MSVVWLNGEMAEAGAARIDPADRGFTLGDGIFETIRAVDYRPAYAGRHFARLREGAGVLRIPVPYSDDALLQALDAVLHANRMANAALRMTLTRGPAARGVLPPAEVTPTLLVSAGPMPDQLFAARLIVAQRTRRDETSRLTRIKSLNYLDSIMARQEAFEAGADDALLLNTRGGLAEATAANVFLFIDSGWVTPPVADGALPGITRALLLEAGIGREASIPAAGWQRAEAGFLANSLGKRPIARIERHALDANHNALAVCQERAAPTRV
jgi:branched-chain amino acid aminotransferase